jgi:hypothetical protein
MVYDDRPDEPSATCHLQRDDRENALCDFPWECLVLVPESPSWTDLHPDMRCPKCSHTAGITTEDPADRQYRFRWPDAR